MIGGGMHISVSIDHKIVNHLAAAASYSIKAHAVRVAGGAFAMQVLRKLGINVYAYTSQVGDIELDRDYHKYEYQ